MEDDAKLILAVGHGRGVPGVASHDRLSNGEGKCLLSLVSGDIGGGCGVVEAEAGPGDGLGPMHQCGNTFQGEVRVRADEDAARLAACLSAAAVGGDVGRGQGHAVGAPGVDGDAPAAATAAAVVPRAAVRRNRTSPAQCARVQEDPATAAPDSVVAYAEAVGQHAAVDLRRGRYDPHQPTARITGGVIGPAAAAQVMGILRIAVDRVRWPPLPPPSPP